MKKIILVMAVMLLVACGSDTGVLGTNNNLEASTTVADLNPEWSSSIVLPTGETILYGGGDLTIPAGSVQTVNIPVTPPIYSAKTTLVKTCNANYPILCYVTHTRDTSSFEITLKNPSAAAVATTVQWQAITR